MSFNNPIISINSKKEKDSFDIDKGLLEHDENDSELNLKEIFSYLDFLNENKETPKLKDKSGIKKVIFSHKEKAKKRFSSIKFLRKKRFRNLKFL